MLINLEAKFNNILNIKNIEILDYVESAKNPSSRKLLSSDFEEQDSERARALDQLFPLEKYHQRGVSGKGVKIAIFDSGLAQKFLD